MISASSITSHHHVLVTHRPDPNRISIVRAYQGVRSLPKRPNASSSLGKSLSSLLHLHIETPSSTNRHSSCCSVLRDDKHPTPSYSAKEDISNNWGQFQGSYDQKSLLDPLQPWLRGEIVKYGEFAQATYDAFDFDSFSEYCGSCWYNKHKLFKELGLDKHGYRVSKYLYAMSHVNMPGWLQRSHLVDTWSKDSNWMGYVAVSDDQESRRIGRRDIVVAWRGTVAPSEWYEDVQNKLEHVGNGKAKVEHGFHSIYTSKRASSRYNKSSASEQVMEEVTRLVQLYKQRGEEVSLTITGHSLGGALALLNAYQAATSLPGLPISVISFGAPRVGNIAFRDELHQLGVKTLRVVVKQDIVPRTPGFVFNETLQWLDDIIGTLNWVYTHVGAELKLDVHSSPYLKRGGFNLVGFHCLETYLHLIDGFHSTTSTFRADAGRDVVLVNKACDMLVDELRIPHCWYQVANKGLVRNAHGRWVKQVRDPEDIPSPTRVAHDEALSVKMTESDEGIALVFT